MLAKMIQEPVLALVGHTLKEVMGFLINRWIKIINNERKCVLFKISDYNEFNSVIYGSYITHCNVPFITKYVCMERDIVTECSQTAVGIVGWIKTIIYISTW